MSYSQNLEEHHRIGYADNVIMVAQQTRNPVMGAVTEISCSGEAHSVADMFGVVRAQRAEKRSRQNIDNPVRGTRRWVIHNDDLESGQYIDREDVFRMMMDPTSEIMRSHVYAVTRMWAEVIIGVEFIGDEFFVGEGGILGKAREGKTPGAGTALPAGQYVPADAKGMTLDKLLDAVERLNKADFGMEDNDQLYGIITPSQKTDLLKIASATGAALNQFDLEQIRTGKPTTLMGVNWIFTNSLPLKATGGPRLCPIFSKKNIIAGIWQGIQGEMWKDTGSKQLPVVRVTANLDCVRAQDKGVIAIECAE